MNYFFGEKVEVFGIPVNKYDIKHKLEEFKDKILKLERVPTVINLNKKIKGIQILSKHSSSHIILIDENHSEADLLKIHKNFDFYNAHEVLSAFFINPPSSFETVGNVIHMNLKEKFIPYKYLIGRILYEKTHLLVINKVGRINNIYRNFDFEVIGDSWIDLNMLNELSKTKDDHVYEKDNDFMISYKKGEYSFFENKTEGADQKTLSKYILKYYEKILVKEISIDKLETVHFENGLKFLVDIKNCYWCSKLQTDRQVLLKELKQGDVFCDVFCGVGPMALPALKKGCVVICNDLNSAAVRCLRESIKLNKLEPSNIKIYNLDAVDFLNQIQKVKIDHFFLNLPEHSLEYFKHLKFFEQTFRVNCYFFCNDNWNVLDYAEEITGERFKDKQISFVRRVSPSKKMYKLSYTSK